MEERFTVQLDISTSPERVAELAERLSKAFLLSQEEAQALLSADSLVLKRAEALALVKMCRQAGVGVSPNAPLLTPAVYTQRWLKRYTLPVVFSLSSVFALALFILWVVPNRTLADGAGPAASSGGASVALPWIDSADNASGAEVESADIIAVEPYAVSSGAELAADEVAEAETNDALLSTDTLEAAASATPDLFSTARDFTAQDLRAILDVSPEVDLRDAYGQTPLMYAAGSNTPESVAELLAAGANPNARTDASWTPLMYGARNAQNPEVVELLLEAGAAPLVKNASGQTAGDIALAYNNVGASEALETLVEQLQAHQREAAPAAESSSAIIETPTPAAEVPRVQSSRVAARAVPNPVIPNPTNASSVIELAVEEPNPGADPALALFDQQNASLDDEENRNLILECLQNWPACAQD